MALLQSLDDKIDSSYNNLANQYMVYADDTEIAEKELMRATFTKTEKLRISNLLLLLPKKIKDVSAAHVSAISSSGASERREQTYLKKTEPPQWEGDPIYFADFKRKWLAQVTPANLPPESELDRLRENIPQQAAKALFGEKKRQRLGRFWKIYIGTDILLLAS